MSRVEQARRAAGITQTEAAAILGVSNPTYIKKEQEPSLLGFSELELLGKAMDPVSRGVLEGVFSEVEATAREERKLEQMTLGEYYRPRNSATRLEREMAAFRAKNFCAQGLEN